VATQGNTLVITVTKSYLNGSVVINYTVAGGVAATHVENITDLNMVIRVTDGPVVDADYQQIVLGAADTTTVINSIAVRFSDDFVNQEPQEIDVKIFQVGIIPTQIPFTFSNGVNTYDAKSFPQLSNIGAGGLLGSGKFCALSLLIGNDSSALANSGYIYGASMPELLLPPSGSSFEDWISSYSGWHYKGPAKTGGYQIFIPSINQAHSEDLVDSSPWFGPLNIQPYNMVFIIDNSVSINGVAPPNYIQCHVNIEAVFSTNKLANLISPQQQPKEPGFELALGLLRQYYSPCCNPDHRDEIAKWLKNVFSDMVGYGKNIITSDITPKLIQGALEALKIGVPLAASLL
jgi:hypothetical protein